MIPTASDAAPACFGLRRVNPFLGVVAVVQTSGARAFSVDGRHWQVQVAAHPPRGLWSGGGEDAAWRWFQFGRWCAADGLTRVPLNPMLDLNRMLAAADELTAALADCAGRVPFALAPERECWLLDGTGAPVALLATALDDGSALDTTALAGDWTAGGRGERAFTSATLAARERGRPDASGDHPAHLERLVRAAAGRPRAAWFQRLADGGGRAPGESAALAAPLPAAAFPALTLCRDWPDPLLCQLSREYLGWLAPYLLTLPGLPTTTRAALERAAVRSAVTVGALWRLYPEILDADLVRRARVEARLRRAHP